MTLPSILKTTAFYALVAIIMVISVFPFYYAILTSLKSGSALFQTPSAVTHGDSCRQSPPEPR